MFLPEMRLSKSISESPSTLVLWESVLTEEDDIQEAMKRIEKNRGDSGCLSKKQPAGRCMVTRMCNLQILLYNNLLIYNRNR